jgi:hypothetical protein
MKQKENININISGTQAICMVVCILFGLMFSSIFYIKGEMNYIYLPLFISVILGICSGKIMEWWVK